MVYIFTLLSLPKFKNILQQNLKKLLPIPKRILVQNKIHMI